MSDIINDLPRFIVERRNLNEALERIVSPENIIAGKSWFMVPSPIMKIQNELVKKVRRRKGKISRSSSALK